MKKISQYIWEHIWGYLAAVVCLIVSVALDMLSPQLISNGSAAKRQSGMAGFRFLYCIRSQDTDCVHRLLF